MSRADRRSLLLGTALASTLLLGTVITPTPALAVVGDCADPGPDAVRITSNVAPIICINTEVRNEAGIPYGIYLDTTGNGNFITVDNSGTLIANSAGVTQGLLARTDGIGSFITIENTDDITANGGDRTQAILAFTENNQSQVRIVNSGDLVANNAGGNIPRAYGISAYTDGVESDIYIFNSGRIEATGTGGIADGYGIFARTEGIDSPITIINTGPIVANGADNAHGIFTLTYDSTSPISITNHGDIGATGANRVTSINAQMLNYATGTLRITNSGNLTAMSTGGPAYGIYGLTTEPGSPLNITNSGNIHATGIDAVGIFADTEDDDSPITIVESAAITVTAQVDAYGIFAYADGADSGISITNASHITATAGNDAFGISAETFYTGLYGYSPIVITNSGAITVTAGDDAAGISAGAATLSLANSAVRIVNHGDISVTAGDEARGIDTVAVTYGGNSVLSIVNDGAITVAAGYTAYGIYARTLARYGNTLSIVNRGAITATGGDAAFGIFGLGQSVYGNSAFSIVNHGDIRVTAEGYASGIAVGSAYPSPGGPVTVVNHGAITATGGYASGIYALSSGVNSPITIVNSGDVIARRTGAGGNGYGYGILASTNGPGSPITIHNSGSVFGTDAGIHIHPYGGDPSTIFNSGDIGASSQLAISVHDGPVSIFNTGTINGFVLLDADDTFVNQAGGLFNARQTSDFDAYGGGGNDLFRNLNGATVHTAGDANAAETTRFINLERFENSGLVSTVDNGTGDRFILSNTVNGTDHNFVASGNSTVALDTFLDGPASPTDTFTIQGNVFGQTTVQINNTSGGPGTFNPQGIPVIFVDGATPNPNAFVLDQPIDTGFFDYDLFFVPTNSGFWELRSFPGGGAFLLPQLVTAAQDIWHQGSSTWFDRTADLRVLLNGGAAPSAYGANGYDAAAPNGSFTPAVWARASGSWLDRDDAETTRAFGRSYSFDLDRDLDTLDFQMGLDLGHRDLFSPDDILVFGLLGGFVHADLDYDTLIRSFDFDGGQVGAYATYLKGGLFVDTLLNAHIYELDANGTVGFPSSMDASTIGLRTDTGYRFGSFTGGPFWEPLATLEVTWADIDGFSLGGNTVSFDDDPNVRGRLGVRAGTTTQVWQGTLMEPFVIGSLWGNFTDDNQATLVSTGRTFRFQDDLDDVWGEVSVGVNFFNPSAGTAVFAKADVTFGDDVTGVGGKAGLRVNW